jgi:membrane protease YdiL (CAAX protease family)
VRFVLPLLLVLCVASIARAEDVRPDAPSSHQAFLKLLNASRQRSRHDIIGRYDAFLASSPGDYLVAIERCKFIAGSSEEDDSDEDAERLDGTSCAEGLEANYPRQPAVVLYRLTSMWGDPALQYGTRKLADPDIAFTPADRAKVLGWMSERQHLLRHLKEAYELGERAQDADATYDATLVIADYLRSQEQRGRALDVLRSRIEDDHDASSLMGKARLLLDLDAPAPARAAMLAASKIGGAYVDPLFEGRVLEATGDIDGARAAYARQKQWNQREVLTRLFYLELRSKSAAEATASYRALRNLGWGADPLGRHRLALALAHPGAPWMFRELSGLVGFLGMILFAALLPACVLVPIHYVSLLRRARGVPAVESRWGLRHAWAASSLVLFGQMLATYVFAYDELAALLGGHTSANLSQVQLAHVGLVSLTLTALTATLFSRWSDWQGLAPKAWFHRAILGAAAKYFVLLLLVAVINRWLISLVPRHPAAGTEGIALSTIAMLQAIRATYGAPALVFFAVLTGPLSEEFLFRGVILQSLARHLPFWSANAIQAVIFALMHDNLRMAPFLITLAVVAGILRRRTGRLATGTVMHAMNNSVASFAIPT